MSQTRKEAAAQKQKVAGDMLKQATLMMKTASSRSDYEDCINLLDQVVSAKPDQASTYVQRGKCYQALKDFQRALLDYSMALKYEGTNPKALANRGVCYRMLGRFDEALKDYDQAVKLEKDNPSHYYERSLVYLEQKKSDLAFSDLNEAIKLEYKPAVEPLLARGRCYMRMGDLSSAVSDLKEALVQDQSVADVHYNLGIVYTSLNQLPQALESFSSAIVTCEAAETLALSEYYSHRGLTLYRLKDYEKAYTDFTYAIEKQPQSPELFFNRGNTAYKIGRFQDSLNDYETASSLAKELNPIYHHFKGVALQTLRRLREAVKSFEKALEIDKNFHFAKLMLACTHHLDGHLDRAHGIFSSWTGPKDEIFHERLGLILSDLERYDEAESHLTKGIQIVKNSPNLEILTRYLEERGKVRALKWSLEAAETDFTAALKIAEFGRAKLNNEETSLHVNILDSEEVQKSLESLSTTEHNPRISESVGDDAPGTEPPVSDIQSLGVQISKLKALRGSVRLGLDDFKGGEKDFQEALSQNPQAEFLYNRARCFFAVGSKASLERVEADLTQSIHMLPHENLVMFCDLLYFRGLCRFGQKEFLDSAKDFTQAASLAFHSAGQRAPEDEDATEHAVIKPLDPGFRASELVGSMVLQADLFYHLGCALANVGNFPDSLKSLNRAILITESRRAAKPAVYGSTEFQIPDKSQTVIAFRDDKSSIHSTLLSPSYSPHISVALYLHERGKVLHELGRFKEAIADLSRVIEIQPGNGRAKFRRAFCFRSDDQIDAASQDYLSALALDPDLRMRIDWKLVPKHAFVRLDYFGCEKP